MKLAPKSILVIVLLVLILALTLAACTAAPTPELDRETGQQARQSVDQFLADAGEFVAGFCGSSAVPMAAIGLGVMAWTNRRR